VGDSGGPEQQCIRWGPDPQRNGAILGVVRPIEKDHESLLRGMQQETATASALLLQPIALLLTSRYHSNFSPVLFCSLAGV